MSLIFWDFGMEKYPILYGDFHSIFICPCPNSGEISDYFFGKEVGSRYFIAALVDVALKKILPVLVMRESGIIYCASHGDFFGSFCLLVDKADFPLRYSDLLKE